MKHTILLTSGLLVLAAAVSAQSRLYVNPLATGANDGSSWADALTNLQATLAIAQSGDEVWVAEGTYQPTQSTDRSISFEPRSGVRIYGGFAGTEDDPAQRDWGAHPTVLSGDIGTLGDSSDNSYNIMVFTEAEEGTLLDGLIFRGGVAEPTILYDPFQRDGCGGGLYVNAEHGEAFIVVRNCRFERNHARLFGGAVLVRASDDGLIAPQFLNCVFEGNNCGGDGGAVYCRGYRGMERIPDFGGCVFESNVTARWGKAMAYRGPGITDTLHVWDCDFMRNRKAGTVWIGYDLLTLTDNHLRIRGCRFEESVSEGTINNCVRTEYFNQSTGYLRSCYIDNCLFLNNWASLVNSNSQNTRITRCMIRENIGTIIFDESPSLVVRDIDVVSNRANELIYSLEFDPFRLVSNVKFLYNRPLGTGGQPSYLFSTRPGVSFQNIIVVGNDSLAANLLTSDPYYHSQGADSIWLRHFYLVDNHFVHRHLNQEMLPLRISSSAFYGNIFAPGELLSGYHEAVLEHSAFDNLDCSALPPNVTCGPGNLFNLDPMFRDPANGDYSLLPCSPLINAGSNAAAAGILTDIAGNPRIQEGTVDIGAYEAPAFALSTAPQVSPACVGASNGSVSIAPRHGCEPLAYAWSPNPGNGPELDGLPPGAYAVTVTDGSGRQITDTLTVPEAPVPALSLLAQDIACGTVTGGSLTASVTGGTAPFGYGWSAGLGDLPWHAGLGPGPYALTVSDANGCLDSASATLALLGNLTLSVGAVPISCHGEADAELTVQPANGAPPFDWQWQGWPGNAPTAAPLGPGLYAVTVTDALGCTAAFAFNPVNAPNPLVLGAEGSAQTQSSPPNGAAAVTTTSGGTQPYGYLWDMGETGHAIGGLAAGTYTVTVTDARGCTATAEVVVELMLSATGEPLGVVLMYPNPAVDWVRALLPTGDWRVELSDASGRVVRSSGCANGDCVLDLSGLPASTYLLRARDGQRELVGKVVRK